MPLPAESPSLLGETEDGQVRAGGSTGKMLIRAEQKGLPWGSDGKEPACRRRRLGFDPWLGKIPWRSQWLPAPVSLPGEPHGRRSLAGYDRVLGVADSRAGLSTERKKAVGARTVRDVQGSALRQGAIQ